MKLIYIAGPFRAKTPWEVEQNIRAAELITWDVWKLGFYGVCPHSLGRFFDKGLPDPQILAGMQALMLRCDAILMIGNWRESKGSLAEMNLASDDGIPIYLSLRNLQLGIVYRGQDGT